MQLADEAWNIGGAPAAESYLNADRILDVGREAKADAVHPGYGFLAENAEFAQAVTDEGMIWVGPPPHAIEIMGDKISSRRAAEDAKVAMVPGTTEPLETAEEASSIAAEFGYPVAIKASHGGGGKGLRVVHEESELSDAIEGARREADAYFGNPEVYVEKYLVKPTSHRGANHHRQSRQRPIPRRARLFGATTAPKADRGSTFCRVDPGAACGARRGRSGRRTIVRIPQRGNHRVSSRSRRSVLFLEMNTRLQVEHTVTEMVTGIDLVAEQLRVATGEAALVRRSHIERACDRTADQCGESRKQLPSESGDGHGLPGAIWLRRPRRFVDAARRHNQPVLRQPDGEARRVGPRSRPGDT